MSKESLQGFMVIIGALLIQMSLGAIYAWNVFTPTLIEAGWSTADTQWPFTIGLVSFAVVMVYAGRHLYSIGPQALTIAGGLLLGLGYAIAGVAGGTSFWPVVFGIGILGGAGIGLGYVVPIAVGMQWFPDKKGLITGIAVAGFGLGAMIWVKLAGSWGNLLTSFGIADTFIIYGVLFATTVLIGSLWMRFPAHFKPPTADTSTGRHDFNSREMRRTTQYWSIFATFAVGATAGLMCIGLMKLFPGKALVAAGVDSAEASSIAGTAMVVFALANAAGRIGWGKISDMIGHAVNCDQNGRRTSIAAMMASQGLFVSMFPYVAGEPMLLMLAAALIGFNFGGNFALFPAITTDTFGHKYFGQNYGYVFLAYGIGGTVGPMLGGYLGDMNNFTLAFIITGVMSLIAAGIIFTVKIPNKTSPEESEVQAAETSGIPSPVTVD